MSRTVREKVYKETVLGGFPRIHRATARPSEQGEELEVQGKAHPDGRYVGLPPAISFTQFQCPNCNLNFGCDPEALGRHIVRHEPFCNKKYMIKPKQCKKCSRWVEFVDGEYNFHVRLCMGDKPL